MTRFIPIPADVVPLLYSGLQLDLRRLLDELDDLLEQAGRVEHRDRFTGPFERWDRIRALLDVIDWPCGHPPVDALVDIDTHRRVLLSALRTELATDRDLSAVKENDTEIRETAARAVLVVESFLAKLPALEVEAAAAGRLTVLSDQEVGERAIVLQLLRHDRPGRWSRAELEGEIYDIDPLTVSDALQALRGEGVLHMAGEEVWASRCARHMDVLEMVSI